MTVETDSTDESDVLFWLIPGETARVRNHCEALGMTSEQIGKLKRKY